jgi:glutamate transport system substrate-binding protein
MRSSHRLRTVCAAATGLALVAAALTACDGARPRNLLQSIEKGAVVLGSSYDQPGLGLQHSDGTMSGFDVDVSTYVVNRIADTHGWKHPRIAWRETPFAQREALIGNGEVDIITATYSITAARVQKVDFAGPYLVVRQGLLVRAADHGLSRLPDLNNGKLLCSVSGSTSAQHVKDQLPGVQLQEFDSSSACVKALHEKKVDAATTDEVILAGFAEQYRGEFQMVDMTYPRDACVAGTRITAGSPFSTEHYGIGLAKGDTASRNAINSALEQMVSSGTWERDLRSAVGDEETDRLAERAGGMADFQPKVGDLNFLDATPATCTAGTS